MTEKVTMDALRQMDFGKARTFHLETIGEIFSAQALMSRAQYIIGCKFSSSSDKEDVSITITKSER